MRGRMRGRVRFRTEESTRARLLEEVEELLKADGEKEDKGIEVYLSELNLLLLYGEESTDAVRFMWNSDVSFHPVPVKRYEEVYPEHRGRPVLENRNGRRVSGKIAARGLKEIRQYMANVVQGENGKWYHCRIIAVGKGE